MPQRISMVADADVDRQTVELGSGVYQLETRWNDRAQAWYLYLFDSAGQGVASGIRLSPRWSPLAGLVPDLWQGGILYVRGPDDYGRAELGRGVLLLYYTADEIPPVASDLDGLTFEVT